MSEASPRPSGPLSGRRSTAAVVLAAGGGTRFLSSDGRHKLLAPFRGRPLVAWAVEAALAAELDETIVVVGAVDIEPVLPDGITVVENDKWVHGQATSVHAALTVADAHGHDAVVVGLGDQPLVSSGAWVAVADATATPIAVATYDGRRRNPVRLHRDVWSLLPRSGDIGARVLMAERPELVTEVACDGEPADVDTVEDLSKWS